MVGQQHGDDSCLHLVGSRVTRLAVDVRHHSGALLSVLRSTTRSQETLRYVGLS